MNKFHSTTLLLLMMLPVIWNCSVLVHYLVEHTHTFCESETGHEHTEIADCKTTCQLTSQSDRSHLPTEIKLLELNQYLTGSSFFEKGHSFIEKADASFGYALLPSMTRVNEVFRPPIS